MAADSTMTDPSMAGQGFKEDSILDVMIDSWYINGPLLILSVLAVYIFFERTMAITKALKEEDNFMNKIKDYIHDGKIDSARNLCSTSRTPIARMLEKGITRIGKPMDDIKASIENIAKLEVYGLEKNISTLATIAGAAPMIGFLGTVIGMVDVFYTIRNEGNTLDSLAGGMMFAMLTTIVGLVVGILAYMAYNYLVARVSKVVNRMQARSIEFFDILEQPGK
ncbi:MAG: MotA/TolQ/ExbB proton channel family protein [Flavobacteriales bacterium]|nr:MotA/TolQ/ExbB proton channel family protein [Flavobacteriales bacterium]